MLTFGVLENFAGHPVAAGGPKGRDHAASLISLLDASAENDLGRLVVFDFSGIELVTASYLKATVLWAITCGRMHAGTLSVGELGLLDESQFKPLDIFPIVAGANGEVQTELQELFAGRNLPCVAATEIDSQNVSKAVILGKIEITAARTLRAIKGLNEFTAYDLVERFPEEGVTATAWNNRLAELNRLRLLRRRKRGKFWIFQPVADHLTYG